MFVIAQTAYAQQDSVNYWRKTGVSSFQDQRYEDALQEFRLALTFEGNHSGIEDWIDSTFNGYVVLLKKEIRGSEMAGQAYKLAKTNPTHALRIAAEAVRLNPGSNSAIQQLHDISEAFPPHFFYSRLKHKNAVSALAISPDDEYLLSGCMDDTARLWRLDGSFLYSLPHGEPIRDVAFSPDGKRALTAGSDNLVKIWSLDGTLLRTLDGHRGDVSAIDISPDGKLIATVSWDSSLVLWNQEGQVVFRKEKAHDGYISDVAFHPDGTKIATAGWDNKVRLWSVDGRLERVLDAHAKPVTSIAFSADGLSLASGSMDGTAKIWEVQSGQLAQSMPAQEDAVLDVAFHDYGLFVSGYDGQLRLWSREGLLLQEYKGHFGPVWCLDVSKDGRYMASGGIGGNVLTWPMKTFETRLVQAHDGPVWDIRLGPGGKMMATAGEDKKARLWNIQGDCLATYEGQKLPVHTVAFVPNATSFATGGEDRVVRFSDYQGQPMKKGGEVRGQISRILFSRDGRYYYTSSWDQLVCKWDAQADTLMQYFYGLHRSRVLDIALSPDERYIYSASRDGVAIKWDFETGEGVAVFVGHQLGVNAVDCAPDGSLIVTASGDGTIKLWDNEGHEIRALAGHDGAVLDAVFSPDGRYILSGGEDRTARLWDLQGRLIQTMRGHSAGVCSVAFTPDGRQMITAGMDGAVRFWTPLSGFLENGQLYRLSEQEQARYNLIEEAAPKELESLVAEAPYYVLTQREIALRSPNDPGNYFFYNAHTYSRKAYATRQPEEKAQLQRTSLQSVRRHIENLNREKEERGLTGVQIGRGVVRTEIFSESNLALWYLLEGQNEKAVALARELLTRDSVEETKIAPVLNSRLVLCLLANGQYDEAVELYHEIEGSELEKGSGPQAVALMTGKQYDGAIPIAGFLSDELALLLSYGLDAPGLKRFEAMLEKKP